MRPSPQAELVARPRRHAEPRTVEIPASPVQPPFPHEAVARIKGSALALDLYVWLVYRLRKVHKNILVPWADLHAHLGADYERERDFRRKALDALRMAQAAYPDARVEPCEGGLLLKPSRPAIPIRIVPVKGPVA